MNTFIQYAVQRIGQKLGNHFKYDKNYDPITQKINDKIASRLSRLSRLRGGDSLKTKKHRPKASNVTRKSLNRRRAIISRRLTRGGKPRVRKTRKFRTSDI